MENLIRRKFIAVSAGYLTGGAWAQTTDNTNQGGQALPYRQVRVEQDSKNIFMFFDFACVFCASYHDPINQWSLTVPKKLSVRMIPVINVHDTVRRDEQALAAIAYYAAFQVATRDQLRQFVASVYDSHHDGLTLVGREIWEKAARTARLDLKRFFEGFKSDFVDQSSRFSGFKTIQYQLVATPSVSVAGRYVLVPDDVGGDQKMFFNILNGLTSEALNAA